MNIGTYINLSHIEQSLLWNFNRVLMSFIFLCDYAIDQGVILGSVLVFAKVFFDMNGNGLNGNKK